MPLAQLDHQLVEVIELTILLAAVPFHTFTAVRISIAGESNFIAVKHTRRPNIGKEKHDA
ncbi:hypothetical protein D3C73_1522910 [compost metagenome]